MKVWRGSRLTFTADSTGLQGWRPGQSPRKPGQRQSALWSADMTQNKARHCFLLQTEKRLPNHCSSVSFFSDGGLLDLVPDGALKKALQVGRWDLQVQNVLPSLSSLCSTSCTGRSLQLTFWSTTLALNKNIGGSRTQRKLELLFACSGAFR